MKNIILGLLLLLILGSCKKDIYRSRVFNNFLLEQIRKLEHHNTMLLEAVEMKAVPTHVRKQFLETRLAFKEIEWALHYFLPHTARSLNGAPLDQLDLDENKYIEAEGLQVIEELLFPKINDVQHEELLLQIRLVGTFINAAQKNFEVITITESHVMEALRLESFRIITLGITGFDTASSGYRFPETVASLEGIRLALSQVASWQNSANYQEVGTLIAAAQRTSTKAANIDEFDYLSFITQYLDPLSVALYEFQEAFQIPHVLGVLPIQATTASLFQTDAFNQNAFTPGASYNFTPEKAALGKELFFDTKLSKDNVRNCASCHHPDKAYSDGLKTSITLKGNPLLRNTPSLNYANYYHGQFWDMRQMDLESQSTAVIENEDEMHGNLEEIVTTLEQDPEYVQKFREVFQTQQRVEVWQVQNALASFIRSLSHFDSAFDAHVRGDEQALTQQQKRGFNLFVGKAQCATCHFIPLFNGTVPPEFTESDHEVLGTPYDAAGTQLDPDLGRYLYNPDLKQLARAFKTPTLRNIVESGPYMHNGVYQTLEEVMDFYNRGGGIGLGLAVENQTLPEDSLDLTEQEIVDVIAFMKTLSDQESK